jgi:hypothetical protein
LTGWLKEATGSYDAPMKAIWVFLIIGVGCYLFLVKPVREKEGSVRSLTVAAP